MELSHEFVVESFQLLIEAGCNGYGLSDGDFDFLNLEDEDDCEGIDEEELKELQERFKKILAVYKEIVFIDSHGGEGEGNDAWVVYRIGGRWGLFVKLRGWYASSEGWNLDEAVKVEPKKVVVTTWEECK